MKNIHRANQFTGKRILSIFLTLIILIGCCPSLVIPVSASSANDFTVALNWNGETSGTNLSWNPTTSTNKVIRLNVSYDNNMANVSEIQPGDVLISLRGIGVPYRDGKFRVSDGIAADKNTATNKNYDWSYTYEEATDMYRFTNNNVIEAESSFSGSFEVLWELNSRMVKNGFSKTFNASLSYNDETINSNTVYFSFSSERDTFTINETAEPLAGSDGLDFVTVNADDYMWVRYRLSKAAIAKARGISSSYYEVQIDADAVLRYAKASDGTSVGYRDLGNGLYQINTSDAFNIIVGYPKATFLVNQTTATVTSTTRYVGTYYDESESLVLGETSVEINLNNYGFLANGGYFHKRAEVRNVEYSTLYTGNNESTFYFEIESYKSGNTSYIYDDFIDIVLNNGEFRELNANEYQITSAKIPSLYGLTDDFGGVFTNPPEISVYALVNGASDYVLVHTETVGITEHWVDMPANTYRMYYAIDTSEGAVASNSGLGVKIRFAFSDDSGLPYGERIAPNGYMRNLIHGNTAGAPENYTGTYAERNMQRDIDTYGKLLKRTYGDVGIRESLNTIKTDINVSNFINGGESNAADFKITSELSTTSIITENNNLSKFTQYTILPAGINVDKDRFSYVFSTDVNSIRLSDGTPIPNPGEYIKRHVSVDIIKNYRNSGCVYLAFHYDFSDNPVNVSSLIKFNIEFSINLLNEHYLEHDNVYDFRGITMVKDSVSSFEGIDRTSTDNGEYFNTNQELWCDLNNNNNTDEELTYATISKSIVIPLAIYQEIKQTLKTIYTDGDFLSGSAQSYLGSPYTYKMKLRTGSSRARNIEFTCILENTANAQWRGIFNSINTEYAEALGLIPTVYYATTTHPTQNSWTTACPADKATIRAIKVSFGGTLKDGGLLYVLVNMTAPNNNSLIGKITENEYSVTFDSVNVINERVTSSGQLRSNPVQVFLSDRLGNLTISKVDPISNTPLMNAEFEIYDSENNLISTGITNEIGKFTIYNIEFGTYTVKEVSAPAGYDRTGGGTRVVVVDSREKIIEIENERIPGSVTLEKTNEGDSYIPVAGATYDLYSANGTLVRSGLVTNGEGEVNVAGLGWGYYYFIETIPASGYLVNDSRLYFEINADNAESGIVVETTDKQKPISVTMTKYDKPDELTPVTNIPLNGAIYDLYRRNHDGTESLIAENLITDENGEITVNNLLIGNYYFKETYKTTGYALNESLVEFSLAVADAEGGTKTVSTHDCRIAGSATVVKKDDAGYYVGGAIYTLYNADNSIFRDDIITGLDGLATATGLPWGSYYFKEKSAPLGYELSNETFAFEINRNTCETLFVFEAINQRKTSDIYLYKVAEDDPNNYLEGAKFNLYRSDGTLYISNLITDTNGLVIVPDVTWGSYYFVETEAPAGYSISGEKHRFSINYLNAGTTQVIYAENFHDTRQVTITKRIAASDITWAHGEPTFIFNLSTLDTSASKGGAYALIRIHHTLIKFDEEYVANNTLPDGYVEVSVIIAGLIPSIYFLSENDTIRYDFEGISDVVNGSVAGEVVRFDLEKNEAGEATFTNVKTSWDGASHADSSVNLIKTEARLTGLIVDSEIHYITKSSTNDIDKNQLTVTAIYDDGRNVRLQNSDYIIEEQTFDLNHYGSYTITVSYTNNGTTRKGTFSAEVSASALFTYTIENEEVTITGYLGDSSTVVFPSTIDGLPVTILGNGDETINGLGGVTSFGISSGIEGIAAGAFENCTDLSGTIVVPDTVTDIGESAFRNCENIVSVDMSENIDSLSSLVFSGCNGMSSINIPEGVTVIDDYAFMDCSGLLSLTIPNAVTEIGHCAFYRCTNLTGSIDIPASVHRIKNSAFQDCQALTSVTFNEGLLDIGESAFYNCYGLNCSITIPDTVTNIGAFAFGWCDNISGPLIIGNGVKTIGEDAFSYLSNITSLQLGNSIESIGAGAFCDCVAVANAIVLPDTVTFVGEYAFCGMKLIPSITINSALKEIGAYAFEGAGATSLTISEGVEVIKRDCFHSCWQLSSVNLPSTIKKVETEAFTDCDALSAIYINKNYDSTTKDIVDEYAFADSCLVWNNSTIDTVSGIVFTETSDHVAITGLYNPTNAITAVAIPATYNTKPVKVIEKSAFCSHTELRNLIISEGVEKIESYAFENCFYITGTLTIPNSVTTIGAHGFDHCGVLTGLSLGSGLRSIGDYAFRYLTNVTGTLILPENLETIGACAFLSMMKITALNINDGLRIIGDSAFSGCTKLAGTINIPSTVESIAESAFMGNNAITTFYIDKDYSMANEVILPQGTKACVYWNNTVTDTTTGLLYSESNNKYIVTGFYNPTDSITTVSIPATYNGKNVIGIGGSAFSLHSELISVSMPDSIEFINSCAFYKCAGISQHLTVPASTKHIGYYAFANDTGITGITMNSVIETIGERAFNGCTSIIGNIVIPDSTTSIGSFAFNNAPITGLSIGSGVERIEMYTFRGCEITSLIIPPNVTYIGNSAFFNNSSLVSLTLCNGLVEIDEVAFLGCSTMTSVIIPDSVKIIGGGAFESYGLTTYTIGSSVEIIRGSAFSGNEDLTGIINLPNTLVGDRYATPFFDSHGAVFRVYKNSVGESMALMSSATIDPIE